MFTFVSKRSVQDFEITSPAWQYLLQYCSLTIWPFFVQEGKWYVVADVDKRFKYRTIPGLLTHPQKGYSGFYVTQRESRLLRRVLHNFLLVQNSLNHTYEGVDANNDLVLPQPWPLKIRHDWVVEYTQLLRWIDIAGGFHIR